MIVAGITVTGGVVNIVVISGSKPFDCEAENEFSLQVGDKSPAYAVIQNQITDFLSHRKVERVALKASSVSGGGSTEAHLLSAELRGVVQVAIVNAGCETHLLKKATVSRLGDRNIKEYLKDDQFWLDNLPQLKKKGLREAAFFAITKAQ